MLHTSRKSEVALDQSGDFSSDAIFFRTVAIFAALFIAFVLWMQLDVGGRAVSDNVDDFGIGVTALIAGVLCAMRSRRSVGRPRTAWGFLSASAFSWAIGEFIYAVLALHETVVTPSFADVGYLTAVPLGLVGILYLASPGRLGNWTARAVIDGAIIAGSLLIISWTTALGSAYGMSSGFSMGRIVNLAYPISDVIVATVALSLFGNGSAGKRTTFLLVIASELCFAFGDSIFAYVSAKSDFSYPDVFDSSWVAAFFLLALASLWVQKEAGETVVNKKVADRRLAAIPVFAVLGALAAEISSGVTSNHLHSFLVVVGVGVLVAIIGRQVIVILNNMELTGRLESVVERLQEREERLLNYALHDPLTGLANRLVLDDRLEEALTQNRGRVSPLAVLLCDLDHFKRINDTLGHSVGDTVLRSTALRLRECVRAEDVIVRTGGDEFAVLIDDRSGFADVEHIAGEIVRLLGTPIMVDNKELIVHVSVGIAVGQPGAASAEALLRDADVALYAAKGAGGNSYRLFDDAISRVFFERMDLQADLTAAISRNEFSILYQPIIDLRTNRIAGIEALLRWDHPRRGSLSPTSFVAMAEESGLIVPIGRWVLNEALMQVKKWRETLPGGHELWVAVNVSGRQLLADDLSVLVGEALTGANVSADALHIELTESTLMDQSKGSLDLFEATRSLGVALTIDDFGTGYSSLAYLHHMPINALKIDKDFIAGLDQDEHATKIIEAVLALAHTLGLQVVAEGIENVKQLSRLIELECEFAQGFLFCEPQPADQFTRWWHSVPELSSPATSLRQYWTKSEI